MEFIDLPGEPDHDGTPCADCGGSGSPSPNRNRAAHGVRTGNGSRWALIFGSKPLDAWALSNLHRGAEAGYEDRGT